MTDSELAEARRLCEAATGAGQLAWWLNENDGGICCGPDGAEALEVGYTDMNAADSALVLEAPTLVPKLLDEVDRLTAEKQMLAAGIESYKDGTFTSEAMEQTVAERIADYIEALSKRHFTVTPEDIVQSLRAGKWRQG